MPSLTLPTGTVMQIEAPHPPSVYAAPPNPSAAMFIPTPGPPGTSVDSSFETFIAGASLSGHRVVTVNNSGAAVYADPTNIAHVQRPVYLTLGAVSSGSPAVVKAEGVVNEPSWSWTPGNPIYLGLSGVLTQTPPVGAVFMRVVANVVSATSIDFDPQQSIIL